jgi:hypothetical protein
MQVTTYRSKVLPIVFISLLLFCLFIGMNQAQDPSMLPQSPRAAVLQDTHPMIVSSDAQKLNAWREFAAKYGRGWHISIDQRNMIPALINGQGITWMDSGRENDLAALDARARAFLIDNYALLQIDPGHLALNTDTSGFVEARSGIQNINYDYFYNGVPVLDARVIFRLNHGNLVQFGAEKVGPIDIATVPDITKETALATALQAAGGVQRQVGFLDTGTLYVLPMAAEAATGAATYPPGAGYAYKLIYQFIFQFPDDVRTIVAQIDAHTGAVVDLYDDTKYGDVTGGVYSRTVEEELSVLRPFQFALVSNNGNQVTDLGGYYAYRGGTASSQLAGRFFNISDPCATPRAVTSASPGDLAFGMNEGTDCARNQTSNSTNAARTAFYHLNLVRQLAMKYLTGIPRTNTWFNSTVSARVNGGGSCNAFWSGSVNFLKSSTSCNNTAEIADVGYHEWGHGLDANTKTGVGDSAKGEAMADIDSIFMTHSPCIGPGFRKNPVGESEACPTAVRDASLGPMSVSNVGDYCRNTGFCRGALRYECHCEGHIFTGAVYDLAQLLIARYGENEGWRVAERLFYLSLPTLRQYLPGRTDNAYDSFIVAADDNGNLDDGVPDGDLIYAAFAAHEIAGDAYPNFRATCLRPPATPAVTATPGDGSVRLTWNPVPGAESYQVLRRIPDDFQAFLPVEGNVTGTTHLDGQVANGIAYDYMVVAVAGSCVSPYGNHVSAVPGTSLIEVSLERPSRYY